MQGVSALSAVANQDGVSRAIQMILDESSFIAPENVEARRRIGEILLENSHLFAANFPLISLWQPPESPVIQRLSEICVPTLLIIGERDYPDIHAIVDKLEADITGARKIVIRGAGHMVNLEKPEDYNRVVLDFLHKQ